MSDPPRLVVSMPHAGDTALLPRAVDSVLGSRFRDLVLVVVNDGGPPGSLARALAHVDDPRLVCLDLSDNRGRYYADAVTLRAAALLGTPTWMVHDSDDWSDPGHIVHLQATLRGGHDAAFSGYVRHTTARATGNHRRFNHGRARALKHATHYGASIWQTDSLLSIGGPNPDWRIAWDTMMISLSATRLRYSVSVSAGYHYSIRPNSLATSRLTGMQSRARVDAHERRLDLWHQALGSDSLDGIQRVVAPTADTAVAVLRDASILAEMIDR